MAENKGADTPVGWSRAAAADLTFRPVTDADLQFLQRLYASTRADELAPLPWPHEQKLAFLEMQFRAQHEHYQRHFAGMKWLVVMRAREAVGRLYLDRAADEHSVVDIAFLPEHRAQGLGTALMRDLLDEAAAAGKPVKIYVEKFNPAQHLYRRLGFISVGEEGVYDVMRWSPSR